MKLLLPAIFSIILGSISAHSNSMSDEDGFEVLDPLAINDYWFDSKSNGTVMLANVIESNRRNITNAQPCQTGEVIFKEKRIPWGGKFGGPKYISAPYPYFKKLDAMLSFTILTNANKPLRFSVRDTVTPRASEPVGGYWHWVFHGIDQLDMVNSNDSNKYYPWDLGPGRARITLSEEAPSSANFSQGTITISRMEWLAQNSKDWVEICRAP